MALTLIASRFDSGNPFSEFAFRPWMIILYFIVGSPAQEEIIFRGLLQTILERRLNASFSLFGTSVSVAALIIAILFGLIYLMIGVATAIALLGLLPGELRRRSSSLLPAIVLHVIFNGCAAIWP